VQTALRIFAIHQREPEIVTATREKCPTNQHLGAGTRLPQTGLSHHAKLAHNDSQRLPGNISRHCWSDYRPQGKESAMNRKILFSNNLAKLAFTAAAFALTGCASLPDASTSTGTQTAECRIAPVTTASISGSKRKPVDRLDQIKAVSDFARFESNARNLSPAMQVQFDEMLRECNR
jgi:hypothetical protein